MYWPHWINEEKRYCPFKTIIKWAKRATGVAYKKYPPLPTEPSVDVECTKRLKEKSDQIVSEVEQLERELTRIGLRAVTYWHNRDLRGHD
jgi:hypothetical protein